MYLYAIVIIVLIYLTASFCYKAAISRIEDAYHNVEGIWQTDDGTTLAVLPGSGIIARMHECYLISDGEHKTFEICYNILTSSCENKRIDIDGETCYITVAGNEMLMEMEDSSITFTKNARLSKFDFY